MSIGRAVAAKLARMFWTDRRLAVGLLVATAAAGAAGTVAGGAVAPVLVSGYAASLVWGLRPRGR